MRHRDPQYDPPRRRRPERYRGPPTTLRDIRSLGVRRLLIYLLNRSMPPQRNPMMTFRDDKAGCAVIGSILGRGLERPWLANFAGVAIEVRKKRRRPKPAHEVQTSPLPPSLPPGKLDLLQVSPSVIGHTCGILSSAHFDREPRRESPGASRRRETSRGHQLRSATCVPTTAGGRRSIAPLASPSTAQPSRNAPVASGALRHLVAEASSSPEGAV